ncbi:hypothetical protein LIER_23592 [Lithospermum erythrorhizon]|uniref:Uncharacterized protein n=1 Tax=Lithospermum erythrorhizon TaxID=34254 RepID=A0AAV3R1Y4_LITER
MKKSLSHKSGLIEGLDKELTTLKKEFEETSQHSAKRAKIVNDLNKELASEKEAAKSLADERAAERDDSLARYGKSEQARAADIRRATEALQQATKERDAALASVSLARVQFANQKIREFLNSPNYVSKVNGECAAYFTSLALDHEDRFLDLVTLFYEVKASKLIGIGIFLLKKIPLMRKRLKTWSSQPLSNA